jgi:hypothetical protein
MSEQVWVMEGMFLYKKNYVFTENFVVWLYKSFFGSVIIGC